MARFCTDPSPSFVPHPVRQEYVFRLSCLSRAAYGYEAERDYAFWYPENVSYASHAVFHGIDPEPDSPVPLVHDFQEDVFRGGSAVLDPEIPMLFKGCIAAYAYGGRSLLEHHRMRVNLRDLQQH